MLILSLLSYVYSFDEELKAVTATAKPEERQKKMVALLQSSAGRRAHPTFEHILPLFVAAGAASTDTGERLWTLPERSLSWAQYRFGPV
jgi:4,5-DOPA dioxygenase extradiol